MYPYEAFSWPQCRGCITIDFHGIFSDRDGRLSLLTEADSSEGYGTLKDRIVVQI
jgi:hypothetical protein